MQLHLAGIRHHGTESARRVIKLLDTVRPDLILVEGPPEFDAVLKWIQPGQLEPPVAILGYNLANPHQATFYPFAEYSPEWQAIMYANTHRIPVQMLDLPLKYSMDAPASTTPPPARDPMSYLAEIDGFGNSEQWWEHKFESVHVNFSAIEHFEAVCMAMTALRDAELPSVLEEENRWREAWMRTIIREKQQELYHNIVVICGAWHVPALLNLDQLAKSDKALLKQLPKSKIQIGATWVPWTNDRLGLHSGYGAGVQSPGWSEHRWKYPTQTGQNWLSSVAQLFRKKQMDISTAHVIEAHRLSETLAALRGKSAPTLEEYNEATATVMCMGDQILLEWVKKELVVGHKMGKVPDHLPQLPIQADFEANSKSLRLKPDIESKEYKLDLREPGGLARSVFLHRIRALDIKWGEMSLDDRSKGTFRELWTLEWRPEMMVELIARGAWGNTIQEAATAWLHHRVDKAANISDLTQLVEFTLPGELFDVTDKLLNRLGEMAALSADISDLMRTVPTFARALRYGNVRNTDKTALFTLLDGIIRRIGVGLPVAGFGLDEEAAQQLFELMGKMNSALQMLENKEWKEIWLYALQQINDQSNPLILGYSARLLFDTRTIEESETARRFSRALSTGYDPAFSAAWLEGFLKGSGKILLYDRMLWHLLYQWTAELPEDQFKELLPVLRRTFSKFEPAERRRIGEKAKMTPTVDLPQAAAPAEEVDTHFDEEKATQAAQAVALILGL